MQRLKEFCALLHVHEGAEQEMWRSNKVIQHVTSPLSGVDLTDCWWLMFSSITRIFVRMMCLLLSIDVC